MVSRDCYVYFTPYGSAEIWDIEDYGRLRRSWLVGDEATAPVRLSVARSAVPASNIGPTEEAGPQDYIGMRFVEGLAYAVPIRYSSPTNSENDPPADPQARDGCGGLGQRRYRGRIENVRIFTMHTADDRRIVPIALKNARVRIMRSVDVGPDITIKQLYTDDQGFVTEYGSRTVEFDHCSINNNKIHVYLSVELIDSPEKVRIKRSGAWYSWTRIETGRQPLSYNSSTRQTLNFGNAVGGNREISLDPNDAGRTFTWIKWSKQLLQQELGSAANLSTTLAIKIETSGRSAYYDRFTHNIHFRTDRLGSERTAMHEFGHFAMHEMQRGNWLSQTGGLHYSERNNKHPNTTITEGFADAFSYIMDEMTWSVLDQESGLNEAGSNIHGLWRTTVYNRPDVPRPLDLNHPFVSEEIIARVMLDLWDGPSNHARFNNTNAPFTYTDGGNDTFEMSLADLFRPFYSKLIPDPVRFYNNLLLENTGANANRNVQMRDIWHFNFSDTRYNVADFTILGTDEISGSRVITHDRDDYEFWDSDKFDKVETYSYQYIGTDVGAINSASNSYNVTTYVQDDYDTAGRLISSETKNANGVTLSDPLQIRGGAELGLHSGAEPRWYNQSSGLTRYTKRTDHLNIELRAQARLTVGPESRISIGSASPYQTTSVSLYDGTCIVVENGATLTIAAGSTLNIWEGSTLLVRNGGTVQADGDLMIRWGGHICVEDGGNVRLSPSSTLYVDAGARMGVRAGVGLPTNLACTNRVSACGATTILNSGVVNVGGGNEALQFDGDDVVSIPNTNSYVNELGQQFAIEAYLRADDLNAPGAQTLFSSRKFSSSGTSTYNGVLFTLYGGRLLLQLDGRNYFSDDARLPNDNGCHHVAVTRDGTNRVRFYVDGRESSYSPTTPLSAFSDGPLALGADHLNGAYGEHFRGMMGELRVWNTWRSGEQIKQTYTQRAVAPQFGLVVNYDMQDPSASQSLSDLSGVAQSGRNPVPGVLGATSSGAADDPT
ncbi:MAG TPA: LamG domain-containing protein [Hymenobacter sp.]|uniref:LamG domain-containing protein n=1 Tax=Hymenobacter sp. TaxID=1898978 RepID=UPI002ED7948A